MEKTFTDENWEKEVLNSPVPVMADFWAGWCAPCNMVAPIVQEVAKQYEGKIKVGKINVDENLAIAGKYNIRGIPTLLFINGGKVIDSIVGVPTKRVIEDKIQKMLKEKT